MGENAMFFRNELHNENAGSFFPQFPQRAIMQIFHFSTISLRIELDGGWKAEKTVQVRMER